VPYRFKLHLVTEFKYLWAIAGMVLLSLLLVLFSQIHCNENVTDLYSGIETYQEYYILPRLPYSYSALKPWIDEKTMEVHHTGHHGAYTAKMNAALQEWRRSGEESDLASSSLLNIMKNIDRVPEKWKQAIRNNAGGYVNHIFFFSGLGPNPENTEQPMPLTLLRTFRRSFHNYTEFRIWMSREALQHFGSGYVWLCRVPKQDYLTIYRTDKQICPISLGLQPLLVIDVWEHAYYLQHQYRKKDYIESWWNLVNWEKVERLYQWWMELEPPHDEL